MIALLRPPQALALLLLVAGLCIGLLSHASHYRLTPGFKLLSDSEISRLADAKIVTTAQLLSASAKKRARRALAAQTKIPFQRLTELALQCDLLRVKGVGPSAVRLLSAGGIPHTGKLRRAKAAKLHVRLLAAKSQFKEAIVVPSVVELQTWITQAKALSRVVEGAR